MDNSIFLVKINAEPIVKFIFTDPLMSIINMKVQIQISEYKNIIVNVIFWEDLEDFDRFDDYEVDDYLIIEGYLSYSDRFEKKLILTAFNMGIFLVDFKYLI